MHTHSGQPDDIWVTIASFRSYSEASVACASLQAAGIPCFLPDKNAAALGKVDMFGGIRLQVAARDAEAARSFLDKTVAPLD